MREAGMLQSGDCKYFAMKIQIHGTPLLTIGRIQCLFATTWDFEYGNFRWPNVLGLPKRGEIPRYAREIGSVGPGNPPLYIDLLEQSWESKLGMKALAEPVYFQNQAARLHLHSLHDV